MPDLHGWITQQIDETQRIAEAARGQGDGRWRHDSSYPNGYVYDDGNQPVVYDESAPFPEEAAHIALHDPASVLRRCAADRKILAEHRPHGGKWEPYACEGCGMDGGDCADWMTEHINDCPTLLALAEGYGMTPEILATLDRPEKPARPPYPGRTGDVVTDSIASMYAAYLEAERMWQHGGSTGEPRPEVKAMEILAPELKKIPGYIPTSEEPGPA